MSRRLELKVGGERVALNRFAREMILNILVGMLKSLKNVDPEQEITIKVEEASN